MTDQPTTTVACALDPAELRARRAMILRNVLGRRLDTVELVDGYTVHLRSDAELLGTLARLIELERACCPFFSFQVTVPAGEAPVAFSVTGPDGTKALLRETLGADHDR